MAQEQGDTRPNADYPAPRPHHLDHRYLEERFAALEALEARIAALEERVACSSERVLATDEKLMWFAPRVA